MNKYNIENNINFFEELCKKLDENEDNDEENNICLITNDKLVDKYVKLNCGHKFNYIPLYNDLVNYKFKYVNMESHSNKLKYNEIRCPYCRSKQVGLLPYYDDLNIQKYHGINYIYNDMIDKKYNFVKCQYQEINTQFDDSKVESNTNKKYLECCYPGYTNQNCSTIYTNSPDITKVFCYTHQKLIMKQHNQKIKDKLKEEKQQLKEKEKLEKLKQKELLKKAKEEEKIKKKLENKNKNNKSIFNNENIVLGPVNIITDEAVETNNNTNNYCIEIVKSGKNKGTNCCFKQYQDNLCKRHYNFKNKINEKLNIVIENIKNMNTENNIDNNNINI